jgi:vacuolar-type H+-ATPase subunit E/Vma4
MVERENIMTTGTIGKYSNSRTCPRQDVLLDTAWVSTGLPASSIPDGEWLSTSNKWILPPDNEPVLVMLGRDSKPARDWLISLGNPVIRTYLLASPGHGEFQEDEDLRSMANLLVRRIPEVPASAVITKAGAIIWIGGGLSIRLDSVQAGFLRHAFQRLFWHEATDEAWSAHGRLFWRKALPRPFDVPVIPANGLIRIEGAAAQLTAGQKCDILHLQSDLPPDNAPRRLWLRTGPAHHDKLSKLNEKGTEIIWSDGDLPDIKIEGEASEMLLPGTKSRLRIMLNVAQRGEISAILEANPSWRFQTDIRIGDPRLSAAKIWVAGESGPKELLEEQVISLPDIVASSLRATRTLEPSQFPSPMKLALNVKYEWAVVPPRAPAGLGEDPLVDQCKSIDGAWSARVLAIKARLQLSEKESGRIRGKFARLISAMLGFDRTYAALSARIAEIESSTPSKCGPAESRTLFIKLKELEESVREFQTNMEGAEQKAEEDEERERQEAKWKADVEAAKSALPDKRAELDHSEKLLAQIDHEYKQVLVDLESKEEGNKMDLGAKSKKLADDLQRTAKDTARLKAEIESLLATTKSSFVFVKPAGVMQKSPKAGARFTPTQSNPTDVKIPDEALPSAGKLGAIKKQRYLVIDQWSLLEEGEKEAARLSAQLTAPTNS